MLNKSSFTLVEILVVVIIIGVLVGLALPGFRVAKERVLDREAKANLVLIQGAEKIFLIESGSYYSSSVIADINSNLKVHLPAGGTLSWSYAVDNSQATASRLPSGRVWSLTFTGNTPCCAGTDCPPDSSC